MDKWGVWVAIAVAVGFVLWWRSNAGPSSDPNQPPQHNTRIHGSQARQLVQEGATLLDVRTPGEFSSGHVEGALNISVQSLDQRVGELGDKEKPVVVYCRSGQRSRSAMGFLISQGFTRVYDLGPMSAW